MIRTFAASKKTEEWQKLRDERGRGDLVERVGETFEARFPADRASLTSAEKSAEET